MEHDNPHPHNLSSSLDELCQQIQIAWDKILQEDIEILIFNMVNLINEYSNGQ